MAFDPFEIDLLGNPSYACLHFTIQIVVLPTSRGSEPITVVSCGGSASEGGLAVAYQSDVGRFSGSDAVVFKH
jgi:hypothetical protein